MANTLVPGSSLSYCTSESVLIACWNQFSMESHLDRMAIEQCQVLNEHAPNLRICQQTQVVAVARFNIE